MQRRVRLARLAGAAETPPRSSLGACDSNTCARGSSGCRPSTRASLRAHLAVVAGVAEVRVQVCRLERGLELLPSGTGPAPHTPLRGGVLQQPPPGGLPAGARAGGGGAAAQGGVVAGVLSLGAVPRHGGRRLQACSAQAWASDWQVEGPDPGGGCMAWMLVPCRPDDSRAAGHSGDCLLAHQASWV